MISTEQKGLLTLVEEQSKLLGANVYLVGGFVRDFLLDAQLSDLDIDLIVEGEVQSLVDAVQVRIGGETKYYPKFLTAKIISPTAYLSLKEIDFAHARTEKYTTPGSLPEVSPATIHEDLFRRDFSINAIAITLSGFLQFIAGGDEVEQTLHGLFHDPYSGVVDLENKIIRVLHEKSFIDDPTRIFRALRYLVRIDGELEEQTQRYFEQAISQNVFQTISTFRMFNEMKKIFAERGVLSILQKLERSQILESVLTKIAAQQRQEVLEQLEEVQDRSYERFLVLYTRYLTSEQTEALIQELGIGRARWKTVLDRVK